MGYWDNHTYRTMLTSQKLSYMQSHIDATVPDRVLHESNTM
ncbi:hypothetical protein F383_16278 [Gossypium arboreum]|uniref:Uncharacterized protein n=1 Tax=Gossypium arboreum TaxID=29729 RepID=A0A0B0NAY8_GOSAR|nr:hypothetical protein F383_16278 [Gossypium arboreum]